MTEKRYLLGIDNGGTVCKAAIFDLNGNRIADRSVRIPLTVNENGRTERSTESIIDGNFSLIRSLTEGLDGRIAAVGMSGHGKGLYLLDKAGKPLGNGIGSTDDRAAEYEKSAIASGMAQKAYEKTCQKLLACQPVCLLRWLKDHNRDTYDQIGAVLSVNDMVGYFLTGEIRAEMTSVSGTSLLNMHTKTYDRELMTLYGIPEVYDALPPIVGSCGIRGSVTEEAAVRTGIPAGTPVAGGMFDIDACALAAGCVSEGDLCVIAGTWSINEYITANPVWEAASMNSLYCLDGFYLAEESSAASAGNLEWMRGILKEHSYKELDEMVKNTDPAKSRLIFFPFLYCSNLTRNARSCLIGMDSSSTEADIVRAVFEGVAYSGFTHLEKLLSGCRKPPEKIRLAGGVLHSAPWTQIFADTIGIPLETVADGELGCLGAAVSAGIAAGIYADPAEAVRKCIRPGTLVMPDPERTPVYRKKYQAYRKAEALLSDLWNDM